MRKARWLAVAVIGGLLWGFVPVTWASSPLAPTHGPPGTGQLTGNDWTSQSVLTKAGYIHGFFGAITSVALEGTTSALMEAARVQLAKAGLEPPPQSFEGAEDPRLELLLIVMMGLSVFKAMGALDNEGVTYAQVIALVDKYIEEHPEERHYEASFLIWKSLAEAFHPTP